MLINKIYLRLVYIDCKMSNREYGEYEALFYEYKFKKIIVV